jgi:hypothetical protein
MGDPYYPTSREQWDDWLPEVRFEPGIGDFKIGGLVDSFLSVNGANGNIASTTDESPL